MKVVEQTTYSEVKTCELVHRVVLDIPQWMLDDFVVWKKLYGIPMSDVKQVFAEALFDQVTVLSDLIEDVTSSAYPTRPSEE